MSFAGGEEKKGKIQTQRLSESLKKVTAIAYRRGREKEEEEGERGRGVFDLYRKGNESNMLAAERIPTMMREENA